MDFEVIADTKGVEKFSFSKLNAFHQCRYAYDLCYNKHQHGIPNGFGQIGTEVHSVLERYGNGELLQFELVDKFLEEFDEAIPRGVRLYFTNGSYRDLTESYKNQCVKFLSDWNGFDGLEIIGAEEEFSVLLRIKDKCLFLNGFIDVIAVDENGDYYIIDYKSKSAFKSKEEVMEYARQLFLYSIWVKRKYGKYPKYLWFFQFRIDHIEKIDFSEEKLEEVLEWVYETLCQIENEQFWLPISFDGLDKKELDNETFYCRNLCDFRTVCPYWKEALGIEEQKE